MKNLLILVTLFVGLFVGASNAENTENGSQNGVNSAEATVSDEENLKGMESAQNSPWDPRDTLQNSAGTKDAIVASELRDE
jgi:hypothetical protein